ncbi:MAG: hypothetical protein NTZ16_15555, partial [Verrucomicrobia bacterium]|nr:hypothetical protein [Verrucomicrobiota bacterium]
KLTAEGRPVFVIGGHYGATSQMAFGLRREGVETFCLTADAPKNQFYFWPGYTNRPADNAIFFQVLGSALLQPPPARLTNEFASVTGAGVFPAEYHGKTIRWVQIFECRNLR